MTHLRIRHGSVWNSVELEVDNDSAGLRAELEYLFLSRGGSSSGSIIFVTPLLLRQSAAELGQIIARHGVKTEYDTASLRLLNDHLSETQARQRAHSIIPMTPSELNRKLESTRFRRSLTSRQVRDVGRLMRLLHGANFSVPGAGKTASLLAVYEILKSEGVVERLLVVAPKNAMMAWEDEADSCYNGSPPPMRRITGGPAGAIEALGTDPEIAMITYQFLPNVFEVVQSWAFSHKCHIVLDEAHRIKAGGTGVTASAALMLSGVGVRRDILTGTPMPQSAEDLRAQFEFLWPGQRILPEGRLDVYTADSFLEEIRREVVPLYVRTTANELDIPDPEIKPIVVELGPVQRELYELMRSEAHRVTSGLDPTNQAFFRSLGKQVMRLLQAASNPMLLAQTGVLEHEEPGESSNVHGFELLRQFARHEQPAKVAAAVARATAALHEDEKEKVVIWTSFVHNIPYLERLLSEFGPVTLWGAIGTGDEEDPATREGRIKRFHREKSCRVLIANPAACGEGVSLHMASHYAIYLDRTFNAAHFLQSIDRIHRLGLSKLDRIRVDIVQANGTIDARVAKRLQKKILAMQMILNDPQLARLAYDPEDVLEEYPAGLETEDVSEVLEHLAKAGKEE